MLKLWKDSEIREKEKLMKAESEARKRIEQLDATAKKRQQRIEQNEKQYQKALIEYKARCEEFAYNQPAFVRLCVLIQRGIDAQKHGQTTFIGYIVENLRYYNLYEFRDFVNKLCPPEILPPVKKELSEKDLED